MSVAAVQALVIVDVQAGLVSGDHAVPEADQLVTRVAGLLAQARHAGILIVHLQNDGRPGEPDEPGQPGWELQLPPGPAEPVIRKTADDGFQGTDLERVLTMHGISRIAIAGLQSELCVSATARTALGQGFGVVLPHDAHSTYDIPASPGLGPAVPAQVVARVAEWALGDQIELVDRSADVVFSRAMP
jgi:nicotinamidase-related amidase